MMAVFRRHVTMSMDRCRTAIVRRITRSLCYNKATTNPNKNRVSPQEAIIINTAASNVFLFHFRMPFEAWKYNCMLLADGWDYGSNGHDVILLRLLGCSSKATGTSSPGRSSSRVVLQKITEAGPTPDMGRTYMTMADNPHIRELNGYPHGH